MKPGKYIWRKRDGDYPVTVLESFGVMDGREYVRVEGSSTGIPFDECIPEIEVRMSKAAANHKASLKQLLQKRYNEHIAKYPEDHSEFVEWNDLDETMAKELKEQYELDNKKPH